MSESERTRVRERGAPQLNGYEMILKQRKDWDQRQLTGPVVIKPSDREAQVSRQGRLTYYLDPNQYKDTPLQDWHVFLNDIRTHSGKHRHQGGLVIYVIEGKGWSIVDDERVDWQTGDLLLLPIKHQGVTHQHFNAEPGKPCLWIAFVYIPLMDHVAMELTQISNSPDFKG
jgi:hypothetical protein